MAESTQWQQGDVLGVRISQLPAGLKARADKRGAVLAEGEATGHYHVAEGAVDLFESEDGTLYLQVAEQATVTHQEHKPVTLEPGVYQIGIVQEYDYLAEIVRNVRD